MASQTFLNFPVVWQHCLRCVNFSVSAKSYEKHRSNTITIPITCNPDTIDSTFNWIDLQFLAHSTKTCFGTECFASWRRDYKKKFKSCFPPPSKWVNWTFSHKTRSIIVHLKNPIKLPKCCFFLNLGHTDEPKCAWLAISRRVTLRVFHKLYLIQPQNFLSLSVNDLELLKCKMMSTKIIIFPPSESDSQVLTHIRLLSSHDRLAGGILLLSLFISHMKKPPK